jgi:hypothetical protein
MTARFKSFLTMTAVAVGSAVLFWLLRDHWGHALGALPYLLFLACPVMHLFMHHGHGNGHHHHDHPPRQDEPTARPGS